MGEQIWKPVIIVFSVELRFLIFAFSGYSATIHPTRKIIFRPKKGQKRGIV